MQAANENMDQYEPGEALDRLVATKLNLPYVVATGGTQRKMRYSTDIADAWLAVEKMVNLGYTVVVSGKSQRDWLVDIEVSGGVAAGPACAYAPEAICKGVLIALEVGR